MDDGFVDVGEEPLLADEVLELGLAHRLVHPVADHGETHLNAAAPEVGDDVVDDVAGGGVHRDHRRHLEHQVLRQVHVLNVCDIRQQHVLDVLGVRKVERGAKAANENVGDERTRALLLDVPVDRRARNPPKNDDLGLGGLVDDDRQRKRYARCDALEDTQEHHKRGRREPNNEVLFGHLIQLNGTSDIDQRYDGGDDDGSKRKFRHPKEPRSEEKQGEHDDQR
mmetsp:Transcript_10789/g.29054  ORF Transcript_10789/g.29054 Transcript_10789/m.29054 type:complete len:224 (-) Transcript_10789:1379-2050(-)